jgi:hypothetical protein
MKNTLRLLFAGALAFAIHSRTRAQYAPPPPPAPFAGFANEALRKSDPASPWDIGGSARVRYEVKDGFGIPGIVGSVDFRDHRADVNND